MPMKGVEGEGGRERRDAEGREEGSKGDRKLKILKGKGRVIHCGHSGRRNR